MQPARAAWADILLNTPFAWRTALDIALADARAGRAEADPG